MEACFEKFLLFSLSEFFEVGVPECLFGCDAFIGVIGEHEFDEFSAFFRSMLQQLFETSALLFAFSYNAMSIETFEGKLISMCVACLLKRSSTLVLGVPRMLWILCT